jgi:membrane-bound metal-dependent hydrolase YbcI (DUF457 family)
LDPLTQGLLGAAAAQALFGRRLRRAWLIGAVGGVLPDADVLIRSPVDPLLAIEYHRQFTHSLAFIPVGGGIAALPWLAFRRWRARWKPVLGAAVAGYATHGLLDAFTTYGTQLLWPFSSYRVAWNAVAIVDPVFTLALLLGVVWAARVQERVAAARGDARVRGEVFPTLGNNLVWRSLYQAGDTLHADRIRVPWLGRPRWTAGTAVALTREHDLEPPARADARVRQDFRRFRWFSDGWTARAPSDPGVIGDARYSLRTDAFEPIWGVRFHPGRPLGRDHRRRPRVPPGAPRPPRESEPMKIRLVSALLLLGACTPGAPGPRPLSYDPPGSTVTTDKPIEEVRRRTIGFQDRGVWFSNELEGGRLNDVWSEGDSVFVARVRPENAPINNSAWYAFKVWSREPQTVTVRLTYEDGRHRYWPRTRRAGEAWAPLPAEAVREDTAANAATLHLRVGPDTLWVAGQELLTSSFFGRWSDSLAALPHVRRERIGTSRGGRPIEMLTLTDTPDASRYVLLISRQHPPEVTGTFALVRFVEELAGDTPLAREFRRRFQVLAVPLVNPDGVDLGHWRHNTGGVDLNRDWAAFHQPETRAVRDALLRVKQRPGAEVWFAADFHSTGRDVFYTMDRELETRPTGLMDRWLDRIRQEVPEYPVNDSPSGLGSPVSKNWFYQEFGAPSVTYEVGDRTDRALIREVSAAGARAMMELLLQEVR